MSRKDEYGRIYKIDAYDDWANSAYDEFGNSVTCDSCGTEMRWSPKKRLWYCPSCKKEMDRDRYFQYIMAGPPGPECLFECNENYPFCKKHCELFKIDPDDPMLD